MKNMESIVILMTFHNTSSFYVKAILKGVTTHVKISTNVTNKSQFDFRA